MSKVDMQEVITKREYDEDEINAELAVVQGNGTPTNGVMGEFDSSDLNIPKMKLWSATCAEAINGGRAGDVLFDGALLQNADYLEEHPLELIVLALVKTFVEKKVYNPSEPPLIFGTRDQAQADGFSANELDNGYELTFLVKKPEALHKDAREGLDVAFNVDINGGSYAIAKCYLVGNQGTPVRDLIQFFFMNDARAKKVGEPLPKTAEYAVRARVVKKTAKKTGNLYSMWRFSIPSSRKVEGQLDEILESPYGELVK